MTNFTTVLWDLDGTIVDSSPGVFESFRYTLKTLGLPDVTDDQLKTFMGPPLQYTFGVTLGFEEKLVEECLAVYRDYYLNQGGAINAKLYPGVIQILDFCKEAGITLSLATSKAESGTKAVGTHFDFLKYFDVLGTASNDLNRLSKTDVLTYAFDELKKIDADLSKTVLIGDRIHDIEGARHHDLEVCLVKWGFGNETEWNLADATVSNPAELVKFLGV